MAANETGAALEARISPLSDRDAFWLLYFLAYGPPPVQEAVTAALDELAELKAAGAVRKRARELRAGAR